MSTMTLRAAPHSKFTGFGHLIAGGVARIGGGLALLLDVFAEAQQMAADAHRRFPFTCW